MKAIKTIKKTIYMIMCLILLTGCNSKDTSTETKNSNVENNVESQVVEDDVATDKNVGEITEENVQQENDFYEATTINDGRASYEYTFNPCVLPELYVEAYGEEFIEYYKGFCDAVLSGDDSFECPDYDTYWKILDVAYYFLPITSDCLDMPVYDENTIVDGKCDIVYRYSKEEHLKNVEEFKSKLEEVITTNLQEGDTELERALKLYQYCSTTYVYDYEQLENGTVSGDKYPGGYRMIMDEIGICQEYAAAYAYLLLQVGIDAEVVGGYNEETAHAWNMIRIDNQYYYADVTSQSGYLATPLYYFGMTIDEYIEISGYSVETHKIGSSSNINITDYYALSDDKFKGLRQCNFYEIDHQNHTIKYDGYIYDEIDYESDSNGEYFEGKVDF